MALVPSVRSLVEELGVQQPLDNVRTVRHNLDDATQDTRFVLTLTALFSALAVLLAALGIYGAAGHTVGHRQQEIGLRMALGAQRATVLRMILRQILTLAGIGIAVGTVGALGVTRLLDGLLYGVTSWDPGTLASMSALMLLVAAAASLIPASRASRVDPVTTLREG